MIEHNLLIDGAIAVVGWLAGLLTSWLRRRRRL